MLDMLQRAECSEAKRSRIADLQDFAAKLPQLELQTLHYFAPGMYARVVARPKDALIVGKVHKAEHFYIVTRGRVAVDSGDGAVIHEAGAVVVSRPGTKRAVLALEDSICMTVHRTDLTDLDAIEAELIEPDGEALFDSSNELRRISQ